MRYFNNKYFKNAKRWGLCASSAPLTSNFGDLKLRDLPKLCFSNGLWRNRTLNKSVMTSCQWRHRYYNTKNVTKLTSQDFSILGPLKCFNYISFFPILCQLSAKILSTFYRLVKGLQSEKIGWSQSVTNLQIKKQTLSGDVLLTTNCFRFPPGLLHQILPNSQ